MHDSHVSPRLRLLRRSFTLLLALGGMTMPLAAATTGFNVGSGSVDYNTTTNWVGGTINGIWDSSLTLTGTTTATFAADTVLSTGLTFNFSGANTLNLTSSSSTARTITLGGDIAMGAGGPVNISSNTNVLNVNLGGVTRTITNTSTTRTLTFYNSAITNGNLVITGGGTVSLKGSAAASTSAATVSGGSTLNITEATGSSSAGIVRLASLTLANGNVSVTGYSTGNTLDTVTGAVSLSAATSTASSGINSITVNPNSTAVNAQLSLGSFTLGTNHMGVLLRGTNLGTNTSASATSNSSNIILGTAPTLIGGGGAAGTTTISIIPWAIGGTTTSDTGSTLVTYDAANGIRPLNTATELLAAASVVDGSATANNVYVTGSSATFNSNTTMNSLVIAPSLSVGGTGTLTLTSGVLYAVGGGTATTVSNNINFGATDGYITGATAGGYILNLNGAISGSGNVYYYAGSSTGRIVLNSSASTYTGNSILYGRVQMGTNNALPHGAGMGNVEVYGTLDLNNKAMTINGLDGAGLVSQVSATGSVAFTVGDGNAGGDFSGAVTNGTGTVSLAKIGTGTQILRGASTYTGGTTISAGKLLANNLSGSATGTGAVAVNGTSASSYGLLGGGAGASTGGSLNATALGGATLKNYATGAGNISGAVTVAQYAHLAPGNNEVGTLTLSSLTLASGSVLDFEFNAQANDFLIIGTSGGLTLNGGAFNLFAEGTTNAFATAGLYDLLSYTGTYTGSLSNLSVANAQSGYAYTFIDDTADSVIQLQIVAVPEPGVWLLLASGLAALILSSRLRLSEE